MNNKEMLNKKFRFVFFSALFLLISILITGCSDMVEIQDRDFVLALGISYTDKFDITFALPDLDSITGQSNEEAKKRLLRNFNAKSLPEIEALYNLDSEKLLDYRHLKAIILDDSILNNQKKLGEFLNYISNQYTISRNTLIFYYPEDANEFMEWNGKLGGGIGDYLKKLNKNNLASADSSTLGSLINCLDNTRALTIPKLKAFENSVSLDGGVIFYKDSELKVISEEQHKLYNILRGKGTDYVFRIGEDVLRLKDISCKTEYNYKNNIPSVQFNITGISENLQSVSKDDVTLANELQLRLITNIEKEIVTLLKENHIDFLNLYESSSYKNREIWLQYNGKMNEFLTDLQIYLNLVIK